MSTKSPTLGELEVLVMAAVLAAGDDAYGVTIQEQLGEIQPSRELSPGTVYVTLDRLEKKGYLKSWFGEPTPERGGRAKRHYEVVAAGQRVLREALKPMPRVLEIVELGR